MATIQFENGQEVEFDGTPTPEDIDFVANQLGIISSQQRQEMLRGELGLAQQESQKGFAGRFAGELVKETGKALFKQPAKLAASGVLAPFDIFNQLGGGKPSDINLPFVGQTFQAEAQKRLDQGAGTLGTLGRAALEVPLAGAEALALGKGVQLAKKGITALGQKRALGKALQKTAPVLSKGQEQAAKEAGRIYKTTFGKVKIQPDARDIEIAETVKNVATSKNPFKNIQNIKGQIKAVDSEVQIGLQKNNTIFNLKQLKKTLGQSKEESRIIFGSDTTLEKTYDAVVDEMVRQAGKNQKNLSGLLRARKNFDRIIDKKFPKLFDNLISDSPRTNAVLDVRRAVNDFIGKKLPEGNQYKNLLRQENLMFEAIKNIAARAPKLGTTAAQRFLQSKLGKAVKATAIGAGIAGGAVAGTSALLGK